MGTFKSKKDSLFLAYHLALVIVFSCCIYIYYNTEFTVGPFTQFGGKFKYLTFINAVRKLLMWFNIAASWYVMHILRCLSIISNSDYCELYQHLM